MVNELKSLPDNLVAKIQHKIEKTMLPLHIYQYFQTVAHRKSKHKATKTWVTKQAS